MGRHPTSSSAHQPTAELLRNVRLFAGCSTRQLREIAGLTTERRCPAGTVLFREGDPPTRLLVIAEGMATVEIEGREVARILPGGFIGEISLLDGGPVSATVTTSLPTRLVELDREAFESILDRMPDVAHQILRVMAARLRHADDLAFTDAPQ
jgi:CRP-like cAMP-binding protein